MAWYKGTFACGHEGKVNVIGKMKDREWKVNRLFSEVCEECRKKEQDEANKEALDKASKYDFPELTGSEKQVAWANTIRVDFFEWCNENKIYAENIIQTETTAKFWIDNRGCRRLEFVENYNATKKVEKTEKRLLDADTVRPSEPKYDGVVEIVEQDSKIVLKYPRDYDFINLVKSYDYKWDGAWHRNITEMTGSFADRAAEIGHTLLKKGFSICIHDDNTKEKAINGIYEEEHHRWISSIKDSNELLIKWSGMDRSLYQKARKIKSAKWISGLGMSVDIAFYKEIEQFAKENDFRFTIKTKEKIEKYQMDLNSCKTVKVD